MALAETTIVNAILLETSRAGGRGWKNVRGNFYTLDSVKALIGAIKSANWKNITEAMDKLRRLSAGLMCEGSSDIIGYMPVTITADMVGETIAKFVCIEVKTETGTVSPEQQFFVNFILKNGGFAGVARNVDDAKKIMLANAK